MQNQGDVDLHADLTFLASLQTYYSQLARKAFAKEYIGSHFNKFAEANVSFLQDGGYHVPFAHKQLASSLDMGTYRSTMFERLSIQYCSTSSNKTGGDVERVSGEYLQNRVLSTIKLEIFKLPIDMQYETSHHHTQETENETSHK